MFADGGTARTTGRMLPPQPLRVTFLDMAGSLDRKPGYFFFFANMADQRRSSSGLTNKGKHVLTLTPKNIKRLLWYSVIKHSSIGITDFSFDIDSDQLVPWFEAFFPHSSVSLCPLCTAWTKSWSSPRKSTNAFPSSEHLSSLTKHEAAIHSHRELAPSPCQSFKF